MRNATLSRFFILPLIPNAPGAPSDIYKHYSSDFFWSSRRGLDSIPRVANKGPVGDACHQMPPAGGFGMNSGIADAHPRGPGHQPKVRPDTVLCITCTLPSSLHLFRLDLHPELFPVLPPPPLAHPHGPRRQPRVEVGRGSPGACGPLPPGVLRGGAPPRRRPQRRPQPPQSNTCGEVDRHSRIFFVGRGPDSSGPWRINAGGDSSLNTLPNRYPDRILPRVGVWPQMLVRNYRRVLDVTRTLGLDAPQAHPPPQTTRTHC